MLGSHRDQAHFGRAKWRKRILLPCWTAQIVLLLSLIGLFSYRLSRTVITWRDEEDKGQVPMVEFIWESVNVGFSFISLLLTVSSVIKFVAEVLTPSGMLFNNILNTIFALAGLALDILVYVQHADKHYSLIGLGIDSVLLVFTTISVVYALIVYRRLAAYDDYHLPGNVKPYGYDATTTEAAGYPSVLEPPEPYDPTNPKQNFSMRPRSLSALSALSANSLRLSFSSRRESGSYPLQPTQPSPPPPPELERRASYDHRRSTQFDEYVARRRSASGTDLRHSIEHALGAGFDWKEAAAAADLGGGGAQRDSIVGNGVVASLQPRPSLNELGGRQASWDASISNLSGGGGSGENTPMRELSVNSNVTLAHSLVSVPEVHEEDEAHHRHHAGVARSRDGDGEARQALLGGMGGPRRQSRSPPSGGAIGYVDGLEDIELGSRKRKSGL